MNDVLPPMLVLDILAQPDVLVAGMVGTLIGLAPFALIEWRDKRRKEREARELDEATDYLAQICFLAKERERS